MDFASVFVECLCNGVSDSAADAAADYCDFLESVDVRSLAERAREVVDIVADLETCERVSCCADRLEDYRYRACISVVSCDGERDPLAVFVNAEDDELSRKRLFATSGALTVILMTVGFRTVFSVI